MDEWTIRGQLHWALGRRGSERSPGWLAGAHTGSVCSEVGRRLEGGPSQLEEEGEERFNLADGGTGTLRVSHTVRHTYLSIRCDRHVEPRRVRSLSSTHPGGRLGNVPFINGAMCEIGGGRLFTYHSHLQTFRLDLGGTSVLMNFN